jgi:AbrB family looped-hinge helix DNA binding protein
MVEVVATISSKHQITLPATVRRALGLGASDQVSFIVRDDGSVELRPVRYTLDTVIGSIPALPRESLGLRDEIDEATAVEVERRFVPGRTE